MNMSGFGALLKTLRKQRNMTQNTLSEMLHVTTSAISKWENGKNLPDIEILQKLTRIFDISLDELCNCEETLCSLSCPTDIVAPSEKHSLLKSKKPIHFSERAIIVVMLFIVLLLCGLGTSYSYKNMSKSLPEIRPVASRTTEDPIHGTVYELAHVYEGNLQNITSKVPYLTTLSTDWIMDTSVNSYISVMKVSFYQEPESVLYWGKPDKVIYLTR